MGLRMTFPKWNKNINQLCSSHKWRTPTNLFMELIEYPHFSLVQHLSRGVRKHVCSASSNSSSVQISRFAAGFVVLSGDSYG